MAFLSIKDKDFWGREIDERDGRVQVSGLSRTNFVLGEPCDNSPVVRGLRMEPGFVLLRHAHECHRFEVVVQGSLEADGRILTVGDIMISEPNVPYGPHIAGPEGCTTLEIFSTYDGAHTLVLEGPSGLESFDLWLPEGMAKLMAHSGMKEAALNK